MGETGPDLREIFDAANRPAQSGVANSRVIGELGQPGQSRSLTEAEAQSIHAPAGRKQRKVLGRIAAELQDQAKRTGDPSGSMDFNELSPKEQFYAEWDMRTARLMDQGDAKRNTKRRPPPYYPPGSFEAEARRVLMEPVNVSEGGTLRYADRVEPAAGSTEYGTDVQQEVSAAEKKWKNAVPVELPPEKDLVLEIVGGSYVLPESHFRPTLEAYLVSRGAPIRGREISIDELGLYQDYARGRLGEALPGDDLYRELNIEMENLGNQLDIAWKEKNHEGFISTLDKITYVSRERNKTQRGLYSSIVEGIDLRRDSVSHRAEKAASYRHEVEEILSETGKELAAKTPEEIGKEIENFLSLGGIVKREYVPAVAETVAYMFRIARDFNRSDLQSLAIMYYEGFRRGATYSEKPQNIVSSLIYAENKNSELAKVGTPAAIFSLPSIGETRFTELLICPAFLSGSLDVRTTILAHEFVHWADDDMLGFDGEEGRYALTISSEMAAHRYELDVYKILQEVNPDLQIPRLNSLRALLEGMGESWFLQYGLNYTNFSRKVQKGGVL